MNKKYPKIVIRKKTQPMAVFKAGFNKQNMLYIYPTLLMLLFNIALIIIIIFVITPGQPPQVPLYYGLPRGEQQLTSSLSLTLPIAIASLFITLNSIVAYFTKLIFLKKILIFGSFFASLLATITVINIVLLNI